MSEKNRNKAIPDNLDPFRSWASQLNSCEDVGVVRAKVEILLDSLEKRLKELNCLYGLTNLINQGGVSIEDKLANCLTLVPAAFSHVGIVCACLEYQGQYFQTDNFRRTPWRLSCPLGFGEGPSGLLEVFYLKEVTDQSEDPFSEEEKTLIVEFAWRLSDFIDRNRTVDELAATKERLQSAIEGSRDGIWDVDIAEGKVHFSSRWREMFGYKSKPLPEDISEAAGLVHPDERSRVTEKISRLMESSAHYYADEFRVLCADGSYRWIMTRGKIIGRDSNGLPVRMTGTSTDVTRRKNNENRITHLVNVLRALRGIDRLITWEKDRRKLLREIVMILVQTRGYGHAWIASVEKRKKKKSRKSEYVVTCQAGFPDIYEQEHIKAMGGDLTECSRAALERSGVHVNASLTSRCTSTCPLSRYHASSMCTRLEHDGEIFGIMLVSVPSECVSDKEEKELFSGIAHDIAFALYNLQLEDKRAQLERHLLHSQKMETIGILAGGIAHDLNNMLTPIMGYAQMALKAAEGNEKVVRDLGNIQQGAERAKTLVMQILSFSRDVQPAKDVVSLREILLESLSLVRPSIPSGVDVRLDIAKCSCKIFADSGQIHQVVLNLLSNAFGAMKDIDGGRIDVGLECMDVDADMVITHPNLEEGSYVRIKVADTGMGMDEDTLERIFEPFFTTRAVGEGTGLGLSIVHGIIMNHSGEIIVESRPGEGTAMTVYFPCVDDDGKAIKS